MVRVRAKFVDEGAVNYSRFQGVGFSRPAAEESPTNMVVTEHDEGYRLDLAWISHADFDASRDKYEIEYQDTAWQSEGTNRYEDLAVISDTSYIVRNLEWDAVYNFRVRAAHYDVNGNFEAYSDWIYGSGSPLQEDGPLLSDLGALMGTVEISGAWIADYASVSRADRYARFYSFTLGDENQVQIELTSTDEDTYLYLLSGAGTGGSVIESNDDGGSGTNSKIARDLAAGRYTIEATTYSREETGDFNLTLSLPLAKPGPSNLSVGATENEEELDLSWQTPSEFDPATDEFEIQAGAGYRDPETDELLFGPWFPTPPRTTSANVHLLGSLSNIPCGVRVRAAYYDSSGSLEGHSPYIYGQGTPLASAVIDLGTLTEADSVSGEWDASLKSVNRVGNYNAKFYSFSLAQADRVQIDLSYSDWEVVTLTRASLPSFEEPANFQAGPTANAGELRATWDNPSGFNPNTDKCELQYRLYYPDPEGDGYIWTPWTPTTPFWLTSESHTFSGLSAELHQVRLRIAYRASNGVLEGRSEYVEASATPAAAPQSFDPPTGMSVTPTATGLSASWTAPAGFNPASDKFQVQYRVEIVDPDTNNFEWSVFTPVGWLETTSTYYYISGLSVAPHQARVRVAYRDANNSLLAYSDSVSAAGAPTGQSGQGDSDEC